MPLLLCLQHCTQTDTESTLNFFFVTKLSVFYDGREKGASGSTRQKHHGQGVLGADKSLYTAATFLLHHKFNDAVLGKIPRQQVCSYRKQDNVAVPTHDIAHLSRINASDSVIESRFQRQFFQ